jgi:rRNA maturation endonuclease Nob1
MSYWHVRNIEQSCQSCGKRATVQLYGYRNTRYGHYCTKCGGREVRDRTRESEKTEGP